MHYNSVEDVEKIYKTNAKKGLTDKESRNRILKNGQNKLKEKKRKSFVFLFFEQFNDFLIIILITAACISFFTGILSGDGDILESMIILAIVVFNALLGMFQQAKAEKSLEALRKMSAPTANVIRDGKLKTVYAEDICTGDLVVLSTGDVVCADIRLTESVNMELDESALTGESVPVAKNFECICSDTSLLAERENMVYQGTYVTSGRGQGIVVAVGMDTEVGKIASMLSQDDTEQTPLQKKLEYVGKILGICSLGICGLVFIMGVLRRLEAFEMFVMSVSLAVAAIPEGLPAVVTVMLSVGVQRMARSGAIVRNLSAVETLGGADVICTDKTGTLTENKMVVQKLYGDKNKTLKLGGICCTQNTKNPTELAILNICKENNIAVDSKKTAEEAFSSKTKQMRVIADNMLIVKGAPEIVQGLCTRIYKEGKISELTSLDRKSILQQNKEYAADALRVIAVAYKENPQTINDKELVFCGLIAMSDAPRVEVYEAVRLCKSGGVKTVMITGDHLETAYAVGSQLKITDSKDKCITGGELDKLTDKELTKKIDNFDVIARATPEHKVRIVNAYKEKGQIVAMTGDGVNDAPALKSADIGISLGVSGTDVAKAASDLVLTDDNFATIVKAVRMGREIHQNIKKSVRFLLSCNIGEIITVFAAVTLGLPVPLSPIQILWINLVTDSLPALALGADPCDEDMLLKNKSENKLFDKQMAFEISWEGMLIGAISLFSFVCGMVLWGSVKTGSTMAFCVLSMSQLVHSFNMRSENSVLGKAFFSNKFLLLSLVVGTMLQTGVVLFFGNVFGTVSLTGMQWLLVVILSLLPLLVGEAQKRINKNRRV